MALTFTTTKPVAAAPAQESFDLCKLELLNATESLNQAWMDLTDTQREIDGLQEIMDNVTQSVELLSKYGAEAIPMLNQDGGLEALLQIPEKLITVEKAQEGLGEAAKDVWNKFVELVKKAIAHIQQFFMWIGEKVSGLVDWSKQAATKVANATEDALKKAGSMKVNSEGPAATEGVSDWYKFTKLYPHDISFRILTDYSAVIEGLEKIAANAIEKAEELLGDETSGGVKDSVDTDKNKVEKAIRPLIMNAVSQIKTSEVEISFTWPEGGTIPAQWVIVSSKSAANYSPEETTFEALGWADKRNITRFLDVFGANQRSLGELKALCENETARLQEVFKKKADAGCSYPELTNTFNLIMKILHLPFVVAFDQLKLLKATATEITPLIDSL